MKSRGAFVIFLLVAVFSGLPGCSAYNLLDKLENPGGTPAAPAARKIFVNSVSTTGTFSNYITIPGCTGLSGIAAADCACKIQAGAAGLANSNRFIAWLSDNSNDALCRVQGFSGSACSVNSSSAWYNVKGDLVAAGLADFTSGSLKAGVQYTETGGISASSVFTATTGAGIKSGSNCLNWTSLSGIDFSTVGLPTSTTSAWTDNGTAGCTSGTVYCIEPQ